jgi:hypothetical protein
MRLYVANCTGQNRQINYRLDFTVDDQGRRTSERLVPYKSQLIPARQQMPFAGDLHPLQISEIVEQLESTCGAVASTEVKTAKRMGVVKLIWQTDKPITRAVLADVVDHNMGLLSDQGAARRRNLALVADQQLTGLIEKTPAKMELEFEQVEEDPDLPGRLTEGLRVRHADPTQAPPKRSRSRRAA